MIKKASFKFYLFVVIIFYSMIVYVSCGMPFPFPNITLPITTQKTITAFNMFDFNSILMRIDLTFDNETTEPLSGFKVYYKDVEGFIKPAILFWRDSGSNAVYNNDYIAVTAAQLNTFALQSPHFKFYFVKDIIGTYETDSVTSIVINYSICDENGNSISTLFEGGEKISVYFIPMVFMGAPINAVVPINAFSSSVNKTEIIFSN